MLISESRISQLHTKAITKMQAKLSDLLWWSEYVWIKQQ
jgi:hypothetical protein